jgi:hypothetical protein
VRDFDRDAYNRQNLAGFGVAAAGLFLVLVFLWWQGDRMIGGGVILLGFWMMFFIPGLVELRKYPSRIELSRPTVCIRAGEITVTRPWHGPRPVCRAALARCRWAVGRVSDDEASVAYRCPRLKEPAIVLVLPDRGLWAGNRVAFGSTAELRRRWAAFLELAGVPRLN